MIYLLPLLLVPEDEKASMMILLLPFCINDDLVCFASLFVMDVKMILGDRKDIG